MSSKYEQKINQMSETLVRIEERSIGLTNRLYDKDGDIPAIKTHLEKMNGEIEEQKEGIDKNTNAIRNNPLTFLGKKWFWVILGIVLLSVLGLNVSDIREIIGLIAGI